MVCGRPRLVPPSARLHGLALHLLMLILLLAPGWAWASQRGDGEQSRATASEARSLPLPAQLRSARPAALCDAAIRGAEIHHGLPPGLLFAIGQVESGRPDSGLHRVEPWPWTVQAEGRGLYFDTKAQAVQWVREAMARGIASIDVGCLQVNLLYHSHAFDTLEEAFEPSGNADYAARFLLQLHATTRDWVKAAGFYHSQTLILALSYQERVAHALSGETLVGSLLNRPAAPQPPATINRLIEAWRATLGKSGPAATSPVSEGSVIHE